MSGQDNNLEVKSLAGRLLLPPAGSQTEQQVKLLNEAIENYEQNPTLENLIWKGRRLAYNWQHHQAIATFSEGLQHFPDSPELYRHRGHRYITVREFDLAIADFAHAAELARSRPLEIEPDGILNKQNKPLSNLHFNIWYHWALAYYLLGNFEKAVSIYEECLTYSDNPDLLAATADWLYMTYRRLGQPEKTVSLLAKITPGLEIVENQSYFYRLLMYKGLKQPQELLNFELLDGSNAVDIVTQGYGVGNWYFYNGEEATARSIFEKVIATNFWSAFGYIAAEADLFRSFNK
jgi:tetratricopeptide (TPR) repeat protein